MRPGMRPVIMMPAGVISAIHLFGVLVITAVRTIPMMTLRIAFKPGKQPQEQQKGSEPHNFFHKLLFYSSGIDMQVSPDMIRTSLKEKCSDRASPVRTLYNVLLSCRYIKAMADAVVRVDVVAKVY